MKKSILLLAFASLITSSYGQIIPNDTTVNIPDQNFLRALIENEVDLNNNGSIQLSEASAVSKLNVGSQNIASLKGIEAFKSLENLNCGNNKLTSLDLSGNEKLDTLYCASNMLKSINVQNSPKLSSIFFSINELTSIDLSGNPKLAEIYGDMNDIQSLDLSANKSLEVVIMENNKLNSVNLTQSSKLRAVNFSNNNLSQIDLTENKNLEFLILSNNKLVDLDLRGIKSLERGNLESNPIKSVCVSPGFDTSILLIDNKAQVDFAKCGVVTGISDYASDSYTQFYPNPAVNSISVDKAINKVSIYSLNGDIMITTSSKTVDISSLAEGAYSIELLDNRGKSTRKKLIKK